MELFAADGHDAGGCERVTGKSGMRPQTIAPPALERFEAGEQTPCRSSSRQMQELRITPDSSLPNWNYNGSYSCAGP